MLRCMRPQLADFVAEVGDEIGLGTAVRPVLAARSGLSGSWDALPPTLATQLQLHLSSRNTRSDRGRRSRH